MYFKQGSVMTRGARLGATTFTGDLQSTALGCCGAAGRPGAAAGSQGFSARERRGDSGSAGPRAETTSLCKFPGCSGLPDVWATRAT